MKSPEDNSNSIIVAYVVGMLALYVAVIWMQIITT